LEKSSKKDDEETLAKISRFEGGGVRNLEAGGFVKRGEALAEKGSGNQRPIPIS